MKKKYDSSFVVAFPEEHTSAYTSTYLLKVPKMQPSAYLFYHSSTGLSQPCFTRKLFSIFNFILGQISEL